MWIKIIFIFVNKRMDIFLQEFLFIKERRIYFKNSILNVPEDLNVEIEWGIFLSKGAFFVTLFNFNFIS